MHENNGLYRLPVVFVLLGALLAGCAGRQPLSNYARTGDTVLVVLGGTEANALVPVIRKENVSITITDSAGSEYPVSLRRLFRVYSDPTSGYDFRSPNPDYPAAIGNIDSYVDPHQGMWLAIVDLVDPQTQTPPPLAEGSAHLSVSSAEIDNWVDFSNYNWSWTNGNLDNIPLEILPGTGSKHPLNYLSPISRAPAGSLEPLSQLEIRVSGTPSSEIGGGQFTLRYVNASFPAHAPPRVTTTTPDPNVQLAVTSDPQTDGTTLLHVMLSNPHGFEVNNERTGLLGGKSLLRSMRFNVMWEANETVTDANWQDSLQLLSGAFFDIEGYPIPDITPDVQKVR